MTIKVEIRHEKQNTREYGYGIYINGYVTNTRLDFDIPGPTLEASECVPFSASPEQIKAAERRVRQNARRAHQRWLSKI